MKFKKPDLCATDALECLRKAMDFLDSLPDEFEILGPGEAAVKWPKEFTREHLLRLADTSLHGMNPMGMAVALRALAAIAPERKKRRVNIWKDKCGCYRLREVGWSDPQCNWRKVAGPIEIED